jgi:hypothetical protein
MPNPEPTNGRGAPVLEPARGATAPPSSPPRSGSRSRARAWLRALARRLGLPLLIEAGDPIGTETAAVVRAAFPLPPPSPALKARVAEICRVPETAPKGQRSGPPPQAPTAVAAPGGGGVPPRRALAPWLRLLLALLLLVLLALLIAWLLSRVPR